MTAKKRIYNEDNKGEGRKKMIEKKRTAKMTVNRRIAKSDSKEECSKIRQEKRG